ncbi:MAG: hypothetical protein Q9210_002196 [Variospora velana]
MPHPPTTTTAGNEPRSVLIHITSRLGARIKIFCYPVCTIFRLKRLAALCADTTPERVVLKRPGMRPFKDTLTLEYYEIGDGTRLEMEVDTTDEIIGGNRRRTGAREDGE